MNLCFYVNRISFVGGWIEYRGFIKVFFVLDELDTEFDFLRGELVFFEFGLGWFSVGYN